MQEFNTLNIWTSLINQVNCICYLGILLDELLDLKFHINSKILFAMEVLFVLDRNSDLVRVLGSI